MSAHQLRLRGADIGHEAPSPCLGLLAWQQLLRLKSHEGHVQRLRAVLSAKSGAHGAKSKATPLAPRRLASAELQ
jgi:hypothetical protein